MKKIIVLLFIVLSVLSCATKKQVLYFQDINKTQLASVDSIYSHPVIEVNDILKINITALDPQSILPFQFEKIQAAQSTRQLDLLKLEGYLVNENGNINFPQLGKIHVEGKTLQALERDLEKNLSAYIKDPTVMVRLVNYKITVLGEVKTPGTFTISEENITLPQALGMAGDMTINGKRKDVLVIRQIGKERIEKRIDMTKSDWMNTPFYFLKQNDIVYVEPNNPKVKNAGFIGNVGNLLSVLSIMLSAAIVIFK